MELASEKGCFLYGLLEEKSIAALRTCSRVFGVEKEASCPHCAGRGTLDWKVRILVQEDFLLVQDIISFSYKKKIFFV